MIKKVSFGIAAAICIVFLLVQVEKTRSDAGSPQGYNVVCFPNGSDLGGVDDVLLPYYQISHTPNEGGRCYFRFPDGETVSYNARLAQQYIQQGKLKNDLSYPGPSGTEVFFLNPSKYSALINNLLNRPPVSRKTYNGSAPTVTTTSDAIRILNQPINQ